MNNRYLTVAIMMLALAPAHFAYSQAPSQEEVSRPFHIEDDAARFASPDRIYYPETWFHYIDGNVDKAGITKDLEAIASAGISGIHLFHGGKFGGDWPGLTEHISCLSDGWEDAVRHTALEAQRLGLRFTMQNCPGWAMSGGPWIDLDHCMRNLAWSRADFSGSVFDGTISLSEDDAQDWKDWRDLMVLAFPTPSGDSMYPLAPAEVKSDCHTEQFARMLSGERGDINLEPATDIPHIVELYYSAPVTLRSVEFSPVQQMQHNFSYEPGIHVKLIAVSPDGGRTTVLDADMPQSNWEDDRTMTFACDESTASHYVLEIRNEHPMHLSSLKLLSAARKNNWEAQAAWTLRATPYESEKPLQSKEAFVRQSEILDITASMEPDGHLRWTPPYPGNWTVLRVGNVNVGCQNSPAPPEATGWECDKLSEEGADLHFANYIGKLNNGPVKGLLNSMLLDSWECKYQTWTPKMEEEFRSHTGYDLRLWIPALFGFVLNDHETSARFLYDWRSNINRLFTEKFYGRMYRNAREAGLGIQFETAAGDIFPADILEYFKYADVPMCEIWQSKDTTFLGSFNFKPVRPTASASHIYGKTRVGAEAFTSFELTWDEHLRILRETANQNAAQGVTHMVFHTYTHNPCADELVPGTSFGSNIGTPFLRGQTWWRFMPQFTDCLARYAYMLERGKPVYDVLWYLGDEIQHKPDQYCDFPDGYKYEYCNPDVLNHRLSVRDGRVVTPEGIRYSLIWIPDNTRMSPQTVATLRRMVEAGAVLVASAPESEASLVSADSYGVIPGLKNTFAEDVRALWGESREPQTRSVGKGQVLSGISIALALVQLGIEPDVRQNVESDSPALWFHRRTEGADWYFVAAKKYGGFEGTLDFNCSGVAEIWDPVTGERTAADAFVAEDGRTSIRFSLPRSGSCFVVFDHNGAAHPTAPAQCPGNGVEIPIVQWTLSFPEGWGAPENVNLDSLIAWKDLNISDEGKAFSGTATYSAKAMVRKLRKHSRVVLSLGSVEEIAVVRVNGQEYRPLWCEPYSVDVTDAIRKGENRIEVEVTSTWFNRLAYDASQPEAARKTWTISGPKAGSELRPYGLLGPVTLQIKR